MRLLRYMINKALPPLRWDAMPVYRIIILCAALLLTSDISAQQRVFKNYNVKDGLASSTVYIAYMDRRGFMWFGTDQGLCRFDGTNFTNYTTHDGLPDNEVFRIAEDSAGRLWMICYSSRPCFMYRGVIHHADNDSLLRGIESPGGLFIDVCVDRRGRPWILGEKIYYIDSNTVHHLSTPDHRPATGIGYIGDKLVVATKASLSEIVANGDSITYNTILRYPESETSRPFFHDGACYIANATSRDHNTITKVTSDTVFTTDLYQYGIREIIWGYKASNHSEPFIEISAGVAGLKGFTKDLKPLPDPYPFLPLNTSFTSSLSDRSGDLWISSLGKGVYFIPGSTIRHYSPHDSLHTTSITAVYRTPGGKIFIGFDNTGYGVIDRNTLIPYRTYNVSFAGKKLVRFASMGGERVAFGSDYGLYTVDAADPSRSVNINFDCIKSIAPYGRDSVLVGAIISVYLITKNKAGYKTDMIDDTRTTAIAADRSGRIWLGRLGGLYTYQHGHVTRYAGNSQLSKSRITDLLCDDYGYIWVATHQRGLFVITADSVIRINTSNGLASDICTHFYAESPGVVWVCTNHTVSRITYSRSRPFFFAVHTLGELYNGMQMTVNDVMVDSSSIWIASNDGLLEIPKSFIEKSTLLPVYVTSLRSTDPDSVFMYPASAVLQYYQNNIRIDYIGISYGGGQVQYKYLLNNGSTDTFYTTATSLNFSSLAPGSYCFRIWARNASGTWSIAPAMLHFEILPPFWWSWWFILLLVITAGLCIWMAMKLRIDKVRTRERERANINRKIAETELQALRAQMNEHFIFNSLNSIQSFINKNDTESANFYLANFGRLIRKTMDISSLSYISLSEEIDYLTNYLILEKMRFGQKFDYTLATDISGVSIDAIVFPSMVLQPYVENAIRHGLRHKTDGKGSLSILFSLHNEYIVCRIEDNGIGRSRAEEIKNKLHIEYQSKGTRLSEDKVYLYNKLHNDKVRIEVEDKKNAAGDTIGTIVSVFVLFKTNL